MNRFVEKPKLEAAQKMVDAGNYYWNSGMFLFTAGRIAAEMTTHAPEVVAAATSAVAKAQKDLDFTRLDAQAFAESPSISIDYAVMEKTANAAVVPAAIDWSDLGSWDAIWKTGNADENGNVVSGNATLIGTRTLS